MSTLYITHPCFLEHDTGPGHPERADRLRVVEEAMADERFSSLVRAEAPTADLDVIELAHPKTYIDMVRSSAPEPDGESVRLDPDTVMSPGSWNAALRAVGAGLHHLQHQAYAALSQDGQAIALPARTNRNVRAMGMTAPLYIQP